MGKEKRTIETVAARIVMGIMVAFLLSVLVVAIAIKAGAADLYKMDHDIETVVYEVHADDSLLEKIYKGYNNGVYAAKNYVDAYSKELLFGRQKMVEAAVTYKHAIGWKMYAPGEYNSILYLEDGYLANANPKEDAESIQKIATKIKGLRDAAQEAGSTFLYMQTPGNIDKYGDFNINNVKDFANYNADLLLEDLQGYGIDCLDLRENIHARVADYHSLFFKADHHWRQPVALWATGELAAYMNDRYQTGLDRKSVV